MVVLVIIGVLVLLAPPKLLPIVTKAKTTEAKLMLKQVYTLEQSYKFEHDRYSNVLSEIGFEQDKLISEGGQARYKIGISNADEKSFSAQAVSTVDFNGNGTFNVWMTTKTETTAAGIDALLKEIQALVEDPPGEVEVQRAKDSILNSFIFNYDSKLEVLSQQVTYAYFGFPPDYLARYRQNIEKVTAADVARVAKKYVHRDQMTILVVGPSKGQDRPLESFGKVTRLDITIPGPKDSPAATPEPASP